MFAKSEMNGPNSNEVYRFLRSNTKELVDEATHEVKEVPWSFSKFLVNSEGQVDSFYTPFTDPEHLEPHIRRLLGI